MGVPTVHTQTILLAFAALTATGVGCQVFHEHDAAALRAGHWHQEPDGFGGLKFDTTKDQTEKKITLENCHTLEFPAAIKKAVGGKMYGTLDCKASLNVAGKTYLANVQFSVPHDGESQLINIYGAFARADYPSVKKLLSNCTANHIGSIRLRARNPCLGEGTKSRSILVSSEMVATSGSHVEKSSSPWNRRLTGDRAAEKSLQPAAAGRSLNRLNPETGFQDTRPSRDPRGTIRQPYFPTIIGQLRA